MGIDLAGLWRQADGFLRHHLKSRAVREAERRRSERQSREAGRRLRRAAVAGGASGAGILGYGVLVAPLAGPVLVAAGGGALLLVAAALALPTRRRGDGDFSRAELAALPGDAEDWLLARRAALPLGCRPLLDRIFRRLGDLQPHLASLPPHSGTAWEARRLIGDHLPRLILAYEAIPPSGREEDPEVEMRLCAGLLTIAEALDALCRDVGRDPLMTFETQGRFLETRYRGDSKTPSNLWE